ncbi:L-histidine N(alpha)-methyltransferase [soil metagenome]
MSTLTTAPTLSSAVNSAVFYEAHTGLTAPRKTLSPWLFYDEAGSNLFERITELPEYYLTRTERAIFAAHADEIIERAAASTADSAPALTLVELGAGTATKTGILLSAAVRQQGSVVYQPVDVSESALAEASENIQNSIPGVTVRCQVADYTREPLPLDRLPNTRTLALYIGSSIGNFAPTDAIEVLTNLRAQLQPGDKLLLGTDLAPGANKTSEDLLSAYNDAAGTTAAFNLNVLTRLNRDLGANFKVANFRHQACWNPRESRIEMHLEATQSHTVAIPGLPELHFSQGETIHTENSYKFTPQAIAALLKSAGFTATQTWNDPQALFAVTLATAV